MSTAGLQIYNLQDQTFLENDLQKHIVNESVLAKPAQPTLFFPSTNNAKEALNAVVSCGGMCYQRWY